MQQSSTTGFQDNKAKSVQKGEQTNSPISTGILHEQDSPHIEEHTARGLN